MGKASLMKMELYGRVLTANSNLMPHFHFSAINVNVDGEIVIKYHFKIHSICICKAHLPSPEMQPALHHVLALELRPLRFIAI